MVSRLAYCLPYRIPLFLSYRPSPLLPLLSLPQSSLRWSTTSVVNQFDRIHNTEQAFEVVGRLSCEERKLLHDALVESLKEKSGRVGREGGKGELDKDEARQLFLVNTLPFIAFGVLDNGIMILAGEYIDQSLGAWLALSTMAAAALGNMISDVAGVGLAHYVEIAVGWAGIKHPELTSAQMESGRARFLSNGGRAVGLTIGCLIGMFPLLFFEDDDKKEEEKK